MSTTTTTDGTLSLTLLGLGGWPGEPSRPTPGEDIADFFPHEAGDFEGAAHWG